MSNVGVSEIAATFIFAFAVIHSFVVTGIQKRAHQFPKGSVGEFIFHWLGEVEVVFGVWSFVYLIFLSFSSNLSTTFYYLESRNFTEPVFVFVIMTVSASRPILSAANYVIDFISGLLPFKKSIAFFISVFIIGPILGSFITEPAAMTVTGLILLDRFYKQNISYRLKYAMLGLLFVNISIGGTLTSFAAPPVLMVARQWGWDLVFMLTHFGWKAFVAVTISTLLISYRFRTELATVPFSKTKISDDNYAHKKIPAWIYFLHIFLLILIVVWAHQPVVFSGLFLLFLGLHYFTGKYQNKIHLRQGLLVGFFLSGLVILGGPQRWWLEPILLKLETWALYLGAVGLTAFTDNAALTYLGSQVQNLSEFSKYALLAGSVVGGGLTVMANAPNPAGFGILNSSFGVEGISPWQLFLSALPPTFIAMICFWFLK